MKSTYIVIGVIVIVLLGGGAFLFLNQENTEIPESSVSQEQATTESSIKEQAEPFKDTCKDNPQDGQLDCYIELGITHQSAAICNELTEPGLIGFCIGGVAVANNDVARCEGIEDEEQRRACVFGFAYQTETLEPCEILSSIEERSACVGIILDKGALTSEECTVLQDSELRELCNIMSSSDRN